MTEHDALLVVDGLQINNWDRKVLQELIAGGVTGVNATCAVWEGPTDTLRNIGNWLQLARENSDLVTLATTTSEVRRRRPTAGSRCCSASRTPHRSATTTGWSRFSTDSACGSRNSPTTSRTWSAAPATSPLTPD